MCIKGMKWIMMTAVTATTKGGEKMNLKGYPTKSGWFGEIRKGIWMFFPTEEEWLEYIRGDNEESEE